MNKSGLAAYCLSEQGVREDYPFGPDPLVMKVGSKMFALISGTDESPAISLKCDPETAYLLRQQYAAVTPGYHLNKQHWNSVSVDGTVPDEELRGMIDESYALVARKLTKAEKEQLGLSQK